MSFVSKRLEYFDSSDFRHAIQKRAEIDNPIDLSIGVPEESTPEHVKAAGIAAINADRTRYTPAAGIDELREAISIKLLNENGVIHDPSCITIVPGLTTGLLLVYLAVLDPGDEIIIFDPYYPPYVHLASTAGARVVRIPTLPDFQPDLHTLEASITNRTKVIVVNSPNNPSGAVYPEATLRKIARLAEDHKLLIISDEIYEHFTYDVPHFSIGSIYPNTITMNGFSKEYAMTGWRLGYIAGPSDIINAINELQQYIVMSSSSIAQHAGVAAMQNRPNIAHKYHEKRDYALKRLSAMGYKVHGAQGAYYIFLETPEGLSDVEFVDRASSHGLIIVSGRAFSKRNNFVRISYGADMATLVRGMDVLEKMASDSHQLESEEVTIHQARGSSQFTATLP